jgi:O-antigen/teichoic acid export membrane protein
MAHDLGTLRQGFLNVFSAIAIVALPVCTGIVLVAEPLVHVMLGEKWLDAIPLIQVLAIAGLTQALQTNKGSVYLALGKPKILTLLAAVHVVALIPALVFGATINGVMGAARATAIVHIVLMPLNFIVLFKVIKLPFHGFMFVAWRPIVSTVTMVIAVNLFMNFISQKESLVANVTTLFFASATGCVTYVVSLAFFWKISGKKSGVESLALNKLSQLIKSASK